MPVVREMAWYRGEAYTIPDPVCDHSGTFSSAAGWAITFTVKDAYGGTSCVSKTVGSGITILAAATAYDGITYAIGTPVIAVTSSDTLSLTAGEYVYDVQRTDAGSEKVLTIGKLTVHPAVRQ